MYLVTIHRSKQYEGTETNITQLKGEMEVHTHLREG